MILFLFLNLAFFFMFEGNKTRSITTRWNVAPYNFFVAQIMIEKVS